MTKYTSHTREYSSLIEIWMWDKTPLKIKLGEVHETNISHE